MLLMLSISRIIYYNGYSYLAFQVNNNGNLSPGVANSAHSPVLLPTDSPRIAVFWGDVDTRPFNGGFVWYRSTTTTQLTQRALSDIQRVYPSVSNINSLFIATWDHVGYYDEQTDLVSITPHVLY